MNNIRLKTLRKSKKLSVKEIAEKLGVHEQAVYSWESGRAMPTMARIKDLIKVYGIEILDVFQEE